MFPTLTGGKGTGRLQEPIPGLPGQVDLGQQLIRAVSAQIDFVRLAAGTAYRVATHGSSILVRSPSRGLQGVTGPAEDLLLTDCLVIPARASFAPDVDDTESRLGSWDHCREQGRIKRRGLPGEL